MLFANDVVFFNHLFGTKWKIVAVHTLRLFQKLADNIALATKTEQKPKKKKKKSYSKVGRI